MPLFLVGSSSLLQVTRQTIKAWISLNFGKIPPLTLVLAALERLKNQRIMFSSFLIESYSFLQVTRTPIKSPMGLKFSQIRPWTVELAALEHLEKSP